MKRWFEQFLGLVLCCAVLCVSAAAAGNSLCVTLKDDGGRACRDIQVGLFAVCDLDGTLTADFWDCGLEKLLDEKKNAENAEAALDYALERGLQAEMKTTDKQGRVVYEDLSQGVYLVYCPEGQEAAVLPFLVYMTGKDVNAEPKAEETGRPSRPDGPEDPDAPVVPPDTPPDVPVDPDKPDEPTIPQTGVNVWPMYLLGGAGLALMAAGAVEMRRGRKDHE